MLRFSVARCGDRAAEHVRGQPVDTGTLKRLSQLPAHVLGRQRGAVPGLEQQVI